MKKLFSLLILSSSFSSWALSCKSIQQIGEYLDMTGDQFKSAYRAHKASGKTDELRKFVGDVNVARKISYDFPPLKDLGFPPVGKSGWEPFIVKMEKSSLYGKQSGWKYKTPKGDTAIIRMDYDPVKGGHYNIEVMERATGKESFKVSFEFDCNGKVCSPEQVVKLAEKLKQ